MEEGKVVGLDLTQVVVAPLRHQRRLHDHGDATGHEERIEVGRAAPTRARCGRRGRARPRSVRSPRPRSRRGSRRGWRPPARRRGGRRCEPPAPTGRGPMTRRPATWPVRAWPIRRPRRRLRPRGARGAGPGLPARRRNAGSPLARGPRAKVASVTPVTPAAARHRPVTARSRADGGTRSPSQPSRRCSHPVGRPSASTSTPSGRSAAARPSPSISPTRSSPAVDSTHPRPLRCCTRTGTPGAERVEPVPVHRPVPVLVVPRRPHPRTDGDRRSSTVRARSRSDGRGGGAEGGVDAGGGGQGVEVEAGGAGRHGQQVDVVVVEPGDERTAVAGDDLDLTLRRQADPDVGHHAVDDEHLDVAVVAVDLDAAEQDRMGPRPSAAEPTGHRRSPRRLGTEGRRPGDLAQGHVEHHSPAVTAPRPPPARPPPCR